MVNLVSVNFAETRSKSHLLALISSFFPDHAVFVNGLADKKAGTVFLVKRELSTKFDIDFDIVERGYSSVLKIENDAFQLAVYNVYIRCDTYDTSHF